MVSQNGWKLQLASNELRNDKEVVLQAVTQNGESLRWASKELQNDKEVVIISVSHSEENISFASDELRENVEWRSSFLSTEREILLKCHSINGLMLRYASEDERNDEEIVTLAIQQTGMAFQ